MRVYAALFRMALKRSFWREVLRYAEMRRSTMIYARISANEIYAYAVARARRFVKTLLRTARRATFTPIA